MVTMVTPLITVALACYLNLPALGSTASPTPPPLTPQHSVTKHHQLVSVSPSHHNESSLPPNIEDELKSCLVAFGHSKALTDTIIDAAITKFSTLGFTLDLLADNNFISSKHIQEVLGLPEGTVVALRKFARNWCGQLEVKRARTLV